MQRWMRRLRSILTRIGKADCLTIGTRIGLLRPAPSIKKAPTSGVGNCSSEVESTQQADS